MAMTKPHWQAEKEEIIKQDEQGDNYRIKPRGLNIVWGNDERYWKIPAKRTEDPAELVQVSWLEVTGSVDELKPGKGYDLTFEVGLAGDAFGWKDIQVFLMAKVGKKGRYKWTRVKLDQDRTNERVTIPYNQKLSIDVPAGTRDTTLHFGLYEVWSGKWKGGLKIYNAKVTASP
ncbi:putative phloem protein [Rosa chinensis]|uniref:Putative phloem protein n=1 Tax=Rosa chinensis TaxID=74649 RepID=A0A2P6Q742_ROSCH|nr:protein PHLOEM PROTEIN 2-LIKE A9 [Rosa chinensis]PRQ30003.1 putative phloem protein [Rosa chinensis]